MSAIERIEERFEAVRQASFDGQGASIAVWEAEFYDALAEAYESARASRGMHGDADEPNPYREGRQS
jgi:hypothetical protein